jgi:hemerythrin-like metal-binding protein
VILIEWKEEYVLGVPEIDHEHREMIELINELHENMQAGGDEASVADFLGELFARISAHFALEEKLMREQEYDEYRDHKQDHEKLLDDIRDLMDDYEDGVYVDVEVFARRLDSWFSEHFRTRDARLHKRLG